MRCFKRSMLMVAVGLLVVGTVGNQNAILSQTAVGREAPCSNNWSGSFSRIPRSLDDLANTSTLIVAGTVQSVFASARTSSRPGALLSTDGLVRIDQLLKGSTRGAQIVVAQQGGEIDGRRECIDSYPGKLMQPGDRYIFFLNERDARSAPLPERNIPRYDISYIYMGLVQIEGQVVRLSSGLPFRDEYEGRNSMQLFTAIDSIVR